MALNVIIISLIFGQFISNLDTKKIFERSSHWEQKIVAPPESCALRFYSQVKMSAYPELQIKLLFRGIPLYSRNKVFLKVFIFCLRLFNSIHDILYASCGDSF